MRTPLAVVRSSLDNLRASEISVQGGVYINRAEEGVKRLSSLISRMAEATRLEGMLVGAEKESCDIGRLIAGCVEGYRVAYPTMEFVLIEPPNTIMQPVIADAIAQMLDKLVQNAVDFAHPGTPVTVSLVTSGRSIRIAVENKGATLTPDIASGLFSSMVSSRRDSADHGIHLGLGLYIVRLIAEFHAGTVSAYNLADGSGVRFEVSMFASTLLR